VDGGLVERGCLGIAGLLFAKSSNATVVDSMRCRRTNSRGVPGLFTQHFRSSTAQPSNPMSVKSDKPRLKLTSPSPGARRRPARLFHGSWLLP
jgi:hypothetical protein